MLSLRNVTYLLEISHWRFKDVVCHTLFYLRPECLHRIRLRAIESHSFALNANGAVELCLEEVLVFWLPGGVLDVDRVGDVLEMLLLMADAMVYGLPPLAIAVR